MRLFLIAFDFFLAILSFEKKAFDTGGFINGDRRGFMGLKFHCPASIGKILIPRDVVVVAYATCLHNLKISISSQ